VYFQEMNEHIRELNKQFGQTVLYVVPDAQAVIALSVRESPYRRDQADDAREPHRRSAALLLRLGRGQHSLPPATDAHHVESLVLIPERTSAAAKIV